MKKAALAALGALLLIALTACGSGSGSSKDHKVTLSKDEKAAAANISKAFTAQTTGALSTKEGDCFAEHFVDSAGLTKLKASKLLTDTGEVNASSSPTFDADLAGKFADSFLGCVDYAKRQAQDIAKSDTTVDADKLESCLRKEMPNSYIKKLIVASQTQSGEATKLGEDSNTKLTDCKLQAAKKS
jgi:hypothetical protein